MTAGCGLEALPYLTGAPSGIYPACARDCTTCACKAPLDRLADRNYGTFASSAAARRPYFQVALDVPGGKVDAAIVVAVQVGDQGWAAVVVAVLLTLHSTAAVAAALH